MLPYGSYIAQVANPHPKTSSEPDHQETPPEHDHRGATKVSDPVEPDPMGTTKVSDPEPPPDLPEEDKHEKTEEL